MVNKPKRLPARRGSSRPPSFGAAGAGLDQKVSGQVRLLNVQPHAAAVPPVERQNLTRSVTVTKRGKPVASPLRGQGSRETTCRGCGQRMGEQANAALQ